MTLREQSIEAAARAWYRADELPNRFPYTEDDEVWAEFWDALERIDDKRAFMAAFDAILDTLEANIDEWIDATGMLEWEDWSEEAIVVNLLAVLRDTGDSECDGSATCQASEHILGCYRSKRAGRL